MFQKTRSIAQKYGSKIVAASGLAVAATASHAAGTGIDTLFDSVDISGVATKIGALAIVIVGIALTMKGPAVVKRIIAKI